MPFGDSVLLFVALVVAVILHEVSHGLVAWFLGDDTAKEAGRLTLNPIPHIDPVGSILLPAIGALTGLPVFGFAKPVPVNPARLRRPRRDIVLVSLAGPATNLLLMAGAAVIARAVYHNEVFGNTLGDANASFLLKVVFYFALVNLLLGVFNLLPIPPLDGSALVERLLPREWLPGWYRFRPYGIIVLLVLVTSTGLVTTVVTPFYRWLRDFALG